MTAAVLLISLIIMLVVVQKKESNREESLDGWEYATGQPMWLSKDYTNAEMSVEEKLEVLNSMGTQDISSVFIFLNASDAAGRYFTIDCDDDSEILKKFIDRFFDENISYTACSNEEYAKSDTYSYYITVSLKNGTQYTLFYDSYYDKETQDNDAVWLCGECFEIPNEYAKTLWFKMFEEFLAYFVNKQ